MIEAIDIVEGAGLPIEHQEVDAVAVAAVVKPIDATRVVIGVKAGALVFYGEAIFHDMAGNRFWNTIERGGAIPAGLETVTVGEGFEVWRVSVVESPAVLDGDRFVRADEVEAVVAVKPGAAAAEDVAGASPGGMAAEAVGVSASPAFRGDIVVVPGVAVEEQVVRPADMVDPDGLAVMKGELFEDIVAAVAFDGNGLGVSFHRDLDARDREAFQVDPRSVD